MPIEKILQYPRRSAAVGVLVLLILSGLIYWNAIWQSPAHVFEDMLASNLATTSVTKTVQAGDSKQGVNQYVRLQMTGTNAADWLVTAKQVGSSVTTESIGTPSTGYIRYTHVETSQKNSQGKQYDFHAVTNVWAKSDGRTDLSLNQLFEQTLLDISSAPLPPIGYVAPTQQQNILRYIRDQRVFTASYQNVKRETINGHRVYTYDVSVRLGPYLRMMQAFAHDLGIHSLDTVDPNQYSTAPPFVMIISVDRSSHQLVKISSKSTGFSQTYSDWGLTAPITVPDKTVTTTELQRRISQL